MLFLLLLLISCSNKRFDMKLKPFNPEIENIAISEDNNLLLEKLEEIY